MRPLRWGMIGGGEGAFIGGVHRMAARVDGRYQLVAGVFSSDAEKTKRSAVALGVDPARVVVLPNGIDPEEMIASTKTIEEIREHIGATSLAYISLEGLEESTHRPAST